MKKNLIGILSMSTVLLLAGCGGNGANTRIKCLGVENTSQLTENCKNYVDAMREQQELIDDDYKWNDWKVLFGEENFNGKKQDAGVDVDDYLDAKGQNPKSDTSLGVELKFEDNTEAVGVTYKIRYGLDEKLSDAKEIDAIPGGTTIKNLFAGKEYFWQVESSDGEKSKIQSFETGDYPRWMACGNLFNVRDCGGYMTSSGQRVKQGMIFRGGEITKSEWGNDHALTYSEEGKEVFRNEMGIKNEIDFRNDTQRNDGCKSCWFAEDGDIAWTNIQMGSFASAVNNNTALIKQLFENFAKADEAPVYYHCHGGADRTGTAGILLEAVLGVSYTDVIIDYELTSFSSIKGGDCNRNHKHAGNYNDFPALIDALQGMKVNNQNIWDNEASLKDNVEAYLTKKCNISTETIEHLREIMLED